MTSRGCSVNVPSFGPQDVPELGPVDAPIWNFCIFVFPVRSNNRCVKQELLHLKNIFSLNYQFFCWSPKSPLKIPWRSRTLGPLGDLQGTFPGRWLGNVWMFRFYLMFQNRWSQISTVLVFHGYWNSATILTNVVFSTYLVRAIFIVHHAMLMVKCTLVFYIKTST